MCSFINTDYRWTSFVSSSNLEESEAAGFFRSYRLRHVCAEVQGCHGRWAPDLRHRTGEDSQHSGDCGEIPQAFIWRLQSRSDKSAGGGEGETCLHRGPPMFWGLRLSRLKPLALIVILQAEPELLTRSASDFSFTLAERENMNLGVNKLKKFLFIKIVYCKTFERLLLPTQAPPF